MIRKLTFAIALIATAFTLALEAEAGSKSVGGGSKSLSGTDLGSGR